METKISNYPTFYIKVRKQLYFVFQMKKQVNSSLVFPYFFNESQITVREASRLYKHTDILRERARSGRGKRNVMPEERRLSDHWVLKP